MAFEKVAVALSVAPQTPLDKAQFGEPLNNPDK
jgi:hypothetical protein